MPPTPDEVDFEIEPIIDKLTYDKLQETEKKLYREKDGNYEIRLKGGYEDVNKIKSKNQASNEHLNATRKKLSAIEREKAELEKQLAEGEIVKSELETTKLNESNLASRLKAIEEEHAKTKALADQREKELKASNIRSKKEAIVNELKALIVEDEKPFMGDYFASRVNVFEDGNELKVKFSDHNYRETTMSLEEYKKNLLATKELQAKIKTTQTTGSGATLGFLQVGDKPVRYKDLTTAQKAELLKTDPVKFKQLQEESKPSNFRR